MVSKVSCDNDCVNITNIDDLAYEDYMNPDMNEAFAEFNESIIIINKDRSVSVTVEIVDCESNQEESYTVTVTGASFGEVLSKIYAMIWSSYDASDRFFEVRTEKLIKWFMKNFLTFVEDNTELDNLSDEILETCFEGGVNSVKHVVNLLRAKFCVKNKTN